MIPHKSAPEKLFIRIHPPKGDLFLAVLGKPKNRSVLI
ncbi:hypothetical protein S7335_4501 [Synechococcus sp. PCC 7335]|nr:hypothetical protein S7335_4501 [Synechococcus sp. PCC 7335]